MLAPGMVMPGSMRNVQLVVVEFKVCVKSNVVGAPALGNHG